MSSALSFFKLDRGFFNVPIWLQHLLVIALALVCVTVIARQAMRALAGKKSGLSGCGSCKSCGSTTDTAQKSEPKLQMITPDMLLRNRR
jgi:hypothetical protein